MDMMEDCLEDCFILISCCPVIICVCCVLLCCGGLLMMMKAMNRNRRRRPRPYRDQKHQSHPWKSSSDVQKKSTIADEIAFTKTNAILNDVGNSSTIADEIAFTKTNAILNDVGNKSTIADEIAFTKTNAILSDVGNKSTASGDTAFNNIDPASSGAFSNDIKLNTPNKLNNSVERTNPKRSIENSKRVKENEDIANTLDTSMLVDLNKVRGTNDNLSLVNFVKEDVETVKATMKNDSLLPEYWFHGGLSDWTTRGGAWTELYSPGEYFTLSNSTAKGVRNISVVF